MLKKYLSYFVFCALSFTVYLSMSTFAREEAHCGDPCDAFDHLEKMWDTDAEWVGRFGEEVNFAGPDELQDFVLAYKRGGRVGYAKDMLRASGELAERDWLRIRRLFDNADMLEMDDIGTLFKVLKERGTMDMLQEAKRVGAWQKIDIDIRIEYLGPMIEEAEEAIRKRM